jgi:hypothetical protein
LLAPSASVKPPRAAAGHGRLDTGKFAVKPDLASISAVLAFLPQAAITRRR